MLFSVPVGSKAKQMRVVRWIEYIHSRKKNAFSL